jgi:hypothetical protein
MGSKTPIIHGSSFIQFVIRRRIANLHDREDCQSASPGVERPARLPIALTACDMLLTVSASVGTRLPRTTCRVRPRPQRRCSKSALWLRCRWSALLLRARLLVTFSWLRSFLDRPGQRTIIP